MEGWQPGWFPDYSVARPSANSLRILRSALTDSTAAQYNKCLIMHNAFVTDPDPAGSPTLEARP